MTYRLVDLRGHSYYGYRLEFHDVRNLKRSVEYLNTHKIPHSCIGNTIWMMKKDYTWFALAYENSLE
jgi:hypothetical protein